LYMYANRDGRGYPVTNARGRVLVGHCGVVERRTVVGVR